MIPLYRPEQVRAMDERTIAGGTPSLALMERAAGHLARAITAVGGRTYGLRVLMLCGKGNNGGDGIAAARRLRVSGADARVHLLAGDSDLSTDAAEQLRHYRTAGGRETRSISAFQDVDVVVDCLLGTGSSGALRGPYVAAVEEINERARHGVTVVACDLPTGVDADTGQVEGAAVNADVTVSLGAHKRGLWLWPARRHCGELVVADIGIAPEGPAGSRSSGAAAPAAVVLEQSDVRHALQPSPAGVDKRGRGVILVLAGSPGMSGAPTMVARGALATGVGLLTIATSERVRDLVAPTVPEALTLALPDDDPDAAFEAVAARAEEVDALAIGPGLGYGPAATALVRRLVREIDVPIVLDADGLNVFRGDGDVLAERATSELVCTPHAREFARLLGKDVDDVWPNRISTVTEAARRWRATVVAKGPGTIIASPAGPTWVNATGTAALATGGTGDVLTGMIASAVASGAGDMAAAAAVHVHGLAGQIAAARAAPRSVTAMQVAAAVPAALASLEER